MTKTDDNEQRKSLEAQLKQVGKFFDNYVQEKEIVHVEFDLKFAQNTRNVTCMESAIYLWCLEVPDVNML